MTRVKVESTVLRVLQVCGIALLVLLVALPFYWMILASVKPLGLLMRNPLELWVTPAQFTLDAYRRVWVEFNFGRYFANSAYVAILTSVLTISVASLAAYTIARLRFRGRALMSRSILLIYMFPAIVLAVPLYAIYSKLGLRDSLNGLILVYMAQTLPVSIYMLYSYFQTLPGELEESGLIDGCSRMGVIWRIVIPLSLPAMASVGLFTFMISWNEFLFAFLFLDSPSQYTLSRGIVQIAENVNISRQLVMAASVIATVPILVLFLSVERFLVAGLTAGSVKE